MSETAATNLRLRKHPDYSDGFFEAQEGFPEPLIVSAAYRAGRDAYGRVKQMFEERGFKSTEDGFALSLSLKTPENQG